VTLYAQWTVNPTYTVTYNGNTGTGAVPTDASSPYVQGATVTVLAQGSLVKAGSTFTGWNTLANGSGTSRAAGSTFIMGTANVTLYAQWTANGTVSDSIVIYSDPQNSTYHSGVVNEVLKINPVAVFITGDLVMTASSTTEWDTFNSLVSGYSETYTARGNHDGATNWQGNYDLWYSVDISLDTNTIHCIVLDSNSSYSIGSTQYNWLATDLSNNSTADFTVCFFHHPVYSSGMHGDTIAMQTTIVPLFELHGVDMVFYGHDHLYERNLDNGIYYIQTCGGTTRDGDNSNFCELFIDNDKLTGKAYEVYGTGTDTYTIQFDSFESSGL
jgi:uncharacterized repeat protein (TIGR02543 family)